MHILEFIPNAVDGAAHAIAGESGFLSWLVHAIGGAIVGAIVGGIIVGMLHMLPRKKAAAAH
jgi:predicted DNA repair protein MutK